MTLALHTLNELARLRALVFIAQPARRATPRDLGRWLGVPPEACEEVLHGLADDGLIDPLPELRFARGDALHLTRIGDGWLRWMYRLSGRDMGTRPPPSVPTRPDGPSTPTAPQPSIARWYGRSPEQTGSGCHFRRSPPSEP